MSRPDERETTREPGKEAQEWGERSETGKTIARGGKESGKVEGTTSQGEQEQQEKDKETERR